MNVTRIAAAYIRVSSERQDEYSPASQLKMTRERAEKDGYIIPDEYVYFDDGISGKSTKKRNEFNNMIAAARDKSHPFERIYVWKFSRFARNQEESLVYKNLLKKKNVSVISVSEPIPEGHFGSLIERIIEWSDDYFLLNLSGEVRRGLEEKLTRGEPIVPPPFGYKMVGKTYAPDDNAEIIREIYTRFVNGEGVRSIATSLCNRGTRTKRGNLFNVAQVEYILQNPAYKGKLRSVSNEKIFDGTHEAIVTDELWDAAQERMERKKFSHPKYARASECASYMFSGLLKCSECGGAIVRSGYSGQARVPMFRCSNYNRGCCHVPNSIVETKLNKEIINALKAAVGNMEFNITLKNTVPTTEAIAYDKLIGVERRRLERAKEAYLAEVDSLDIYKATKKEIECNIAALEAERDKTAPATPSLAACAQKTLAVIDFLEREDVSSKAKNEALRAIVEKIIFNKKADSLSLFFHSL